MFFIQKISAQAICSFEKNNIEVKNGQSIINRFYIENNFDSPLILIKENKDSFAIIALPDTIKLKPKEKQTYFIKYLATPQLFQNIGNHVTASYKRTGEINSNIKSTFYFNFQNQQSLYLSPSSPIIFLDEQTNTAQVKIYSINKGYDNLNFNVDFNVYPSGLLIQEKHLKITLEPGEQKIFTLQLENILAKNLGTDFNLSIQAIDDNKKQLAFTQVKILLLSNNKRIALSDNLYTSLVNNTVQLSNWQSINSQNYSQLKSRGNIAFGKDEKIDYQVNLNYYNKPIQGTEMYDSRLEYRRKNVGIKIGNILENFDFPIYGKGIEVSDFINKKNTITAIVAQNNYFLFSTANKQLNGATIFAGNYNFHELGKETQVSILRSNDPLTNVRTNLISGSTKLQLNKNKYLEINAGSSYEFLPGGAGVGKYGFAGGLDYRNTMKRWTLLSNNYYGSPYYGGLRRGAILFDERLGYKATNKFSIYLHYSKVNNTAKYLNNFYNFLTGYNNTNIYSTEFSISLKKFRLNFRPYYFSQYLNQNSNSIILPAVHSFSKHGALDLNYNFNNNQFSLIADYGMVNSNNINLSNKNYNVLRITANYNSRFVGFNATAQNNPYYLNEEPFAPQSSNFKAYSFGPNLHFSLFKSKMRFQASDYFNYYGYNTVWNNALQTQVDYSIHNSWILSAQAFYNFYSQNSTSKYWQTRVGVEKQFLQANAPGYKKLSLVFYGDENGNDKLDADEKPIKGVIAEVDNLMARSNKKGAVNFANLKPDLYDIEIKDGNGWDLSRIMEVQLVRNQTLYIPLIKSVQVKGLVTVVGKNKLLLTETILEGIKILAVDSSNKITSSLTDGNGNFYFNLSAKQYRFDIQLNDKSLSAIVPSQTVVVKQADMPIINFQIVDKSRTVDVQKF